MIHRKSKNIDPIFSFSDQFIAKTLKRRNKKPKTTWIIRDLNLIFRYPGRFHWSKRLILPLHPDSYSTFLFYSRSGCRFFSFLFIRHQNSSFIWEICFVWCHPLIKTGPSWSKSASNWLFRSIFKVIISYKQPGSFHTNSIHIFLKSDIKWDLLQPWPYSAATTRSERLSFRHRKSDLFSRWMWIHSIFRVIPDKLSDWSNQPGIWSLRFCLKTKSEIG